MHLRDDDTSSFVDLHADGRPRLGHLRGLDGLRGLAVAAVVAFHAGFGGMVGGYLGVSTFFTLSGFLITGLLLAQSTSAGGPDLRAFWTRRVRRLYPAAVVTILAVLVLFAPIVATPDQLATLPGDAIAALFNVANWRYILDGSSYADLFGAPSPLLHFWSLAIEEQFYLLFPVVLVGVMWSTRSRRPVLAAVLGALTIASLGWTIFGGLSDDRIYFGTGTRASELLLGSLLALALTDRRLRVRLVRDPRMSVVAAAIGALALAVQLWWWWTLPQSTSWLYSGGFSLYALLSCVVILAAAGPPGPVRAVLTIAPLRWLGARSYAIYLFHWPLFLAVRQTWGDANRWVGTIAVVAISLLLAELSHRVLEGPIRVRRTLVGRRGLLAAVAGAVAVVVIALTAVPTDPDGQQPDFDAELEQREALRAAAGQEPDDTPADTQPTQVPSRPLTPADAPVPSYSAFGDSTALGLDMGLAPWGQETGRLVHTWGDLTFGCGVVRYRSFRADGTVSPDDECLAYPARWSEILAGTDPDVVLLTSPAWTVPDARVPSSGEYSSLGDPVVDDFVRDEFGAAVDLLSAKGALVLLVQWPDYGSWADDGRPDSIRRQADPARMQRLREIQQEVADARPGRAGTIDLAGWMAGGAQDRSIRADGIHFTAEEFQRVAGDWFGPEVERLWQEHWLATQTSGTAASGAAPSEAAPSGDGEAAAG